MRVTDQGIQYDVAVDWDEWIHLIDDVDTVFVKGDAVRAMDVPNWTPKGTSTNLSLEPVVVALPNGGVAGAGPRDRQLHQTRLEADSLSLGRLADGLGTLVGTLAIPFPECAQTTSIGRSRISRFPPEFDERRRRLAKAAEDQRTGRNLDGFGPFLFLNLVGVGRRMLVVGPRLGTGGRSGLPETSNS